MRPLSQFVTEPGVCVCVPLNEMEIVLFFFLVEAADVFDIFLGIPRALRVIRVEKIHLYINVWKKKKTKTRGGAESIGREGSITRRRKKIVHPVVTFNTKERGRKEEI